MRNENSTDLNRRKNETATDIELAIMLFVLIACSFAAGYYVAAAQLAAMLNN
jgi:nitrate reductase NapE component